MFSSIKKQCTISKILHQNMKQYHVYCLSMVVYCSTDSVSDHDNPVVKSNPPHLTLSKWNITFPNGTHNNPEYSKVIQEKNVITHCSSPEYWIETQTTHLKSHVIFEMNQSVKNWLFPMNLNL